MKWKVGEGRWIGYRIFQYKQATLNKNSRIALSAQEKIMWERNPYIFFANLTLMTSHTPPEVSRDIISFALGSVKSFNNAHGI